MKNEFVLCYKGFKKSGRSDDDKYTYLSRINVDKELLEYIKFKRNLYLRKRDYIKIIINIITILTAVIVFLFTYFNTNVYSNRINERPILANVEEYTRKISEDEKRINDLKMNNFIYNEDEWLVEKQDAYIKMLEDRIKMYQELRYNLQDEIIDTMIKFGKIGGIIVVILIVFLMCYYQYLIKMIMFCDDILQLKSNNI